MSAFEIDITRMNGKEKMWKNWYLENRKKNIKCEKNKREKNRCKKK